MKVAIGSKNPVKAGAIKNVLLCYDVFDESEIKEFEVISGVSEQPLGYREIYTGARNRAERAFNKYPKFDLAFGLESGLVKSPADDNFSLNVTACAIYDGEITHFGQSSGFLIPKNVAKLIGREQIPLDEALNRLGVTQDQRIGYGKGFIGLLTDGRIDRKSYLEQAIHFALIPFVSSRKGLFSQQ